VGFVAGHDEILPSVRKFVAIGRLVQIAPLALQLRRDRVL
jgi:hypothetical protein